MVDEPGRIESWSKSGIAIVDTVQTADPVSGNSEAKESQDKQAGSKEDIMAAKRSE